MGVIAVLDLFGAGQGFLGAACPIAVPLTGGWVNRVYLLLDHLLHPLLHGITRRIRLSLTDGWWCPCSKHPYASGR